MRYRLAILTHGEGPYLARALASFRTHVQPLPIDAVIHCDGMTAIDNAVGVVRGYDEWAWLASGTPEPEGFCDATRLLWNAAGDGGDHDYVFWLEHDFVFTRGVDLTRLAQVLFDHPRLAQMALMRGPVNDVERAMGGIVESRPGQFVLRFSPDVWLEHRSYFTTNPSLIPMRLLTTRMPPPGPECEGRFGIELVGEGLTFGAWGDGSPWVQHLGERTGFGY